MRASGGTASMLIPDALDVDDLPVALDDHSRNFVTTLHFYVEDPYRVGRVFHPQVFVKGRCDGPNNLTPVERESTDGRRYRFRGW